jgi:hypothetical protein
VPSNLADNLARQFREQGYTWSIDGKQIIPTAKDLDIALDKAKELLYAEAEASQLEVGRLIIRHVAGKKFDCYLFQGEIND